MTRFLDRQPEWKFYAVRGVVGMKMKLVELKQHIDAVYEMHPTADVDFTYPVRFRGERRSKLGDATGFDIHLRGSGTAYLRIRLEHTGDHMKEAPADAE